MDKNRKNRGAIFKIAPRKERILTRKQTFLMSGRRFSGAISEIAPRKTIFQVSGKTNPGAILEIAPRKMVSLTRKTTILGANLKIAPRKTRPPMMFSWGIDGKAGFLTVLARFLVIRGTIPVMERANMTGKHQTTDEEPRKTDKKGIRNVLR